ncbi:hypothetical protein THASP1DRAFT_24641 [Thamnocephalis sphaerospora]|uniref:Uncharacterized protein n=1 Tax=Thamnocephalis sphaerospora TaxID=78915 RepID=A0A4P9XML8_9FUNG|nr:hypothetical protein THASP1DRAFT_24641 [Thamnocephalis sphaerospora]|eukprot:RKP07158.1 hypothetical protein THASP1DRAFT_24641 [Thamnocephalis sphaerospora]
MPKELLVRLKTALMEEYQSLSQIEIPAAETRRLASLKQLKALLKLFFPQRSVGNTMGRLMELLLDAKDKEICVRSLAEEFPPAREQRHNLQQAMAALEKLGLTITATRAPKDGETAEDEPVLRIHFAEAESAE